MQLSYLASHPIIGGISKYSMAMAVHNSVCGLMNEQLNTCNDSTKAAP